MTEGTLEINLTGTQVKLQEAKSWLGKLFQKITGVPKVEQEVVTQLQYLEKIYNVFKDLGYKNVLSLEMNGKEVYADDAYTSDDLDNAMQLALKETPEEVYHSELILQEIDGSEEDTINVNMYSQHEEGEMPLVISVSLGKTPEEVETFLEKLKTKINEKFQIEAGEVSVDEDSYEEEEPIEEEETPEETEEIEKEKAE